MPKARLTQEEKADLAQELSAAQSPAERSAIIELCCSIYRVKPQTAYRWAREGGYESGRKQRSDSGQTKSTVDMEAVKEAAVKHPDEVIALFTHRVICKVIILGLLGLDVSRFWQIAQDTACINLFEYGQDKVVIRYINETCYIKGLIKGAFVDF